MPAVDYECGAHSPLRSEEIALVHDLVGALTDEQQDELARQVVGQAERLDALGAVLARYPSPLEAQTLGGRRRGVDTLVESLSKVDRIGFTLSAPTQAVIGRALNIAQVNFFRMLWLTCAELRDAERAARLRERTAERLRASVYTQLIEEVLSAIVTDDALPRPARSRAVLQLAQLWGHRLTWRLSEFFPLLAATWEARARIRVVGGTLLGTAEMFQLLARGADANFIEVLTQAEHDCDEAQAFREFLFGTSLEELDRLTERMAREGLSSIELDMQTNTALDGGTLFYQFFEMRLQRAYARRLTGLPGPKHTAEGYVVLTWLQRDHQTREVQA